MLLEALMASIDKMQASAEEHNSRQSFIDDTFDDARSNQKSRPERTKHAKGAPPLSHRCIHCLRLNTAYLQFSQRLTYIALMQ